MSTGTVVPADESARQGGDSIRSGRGPTPRTDLIESWLVNHLNLVALAIVAAGFVLRIYIATLSYLNPDEALHYLLMNQPSVFLAYKASLTNAHPPLIYMVLYYWHFLGRSELMLRLPSVLAGTAFCWVAFRWIGNVFGKAAGLIGLILCAFSPAMVSLSTEVRAYALMLLCMAGALYFLGRAFDEKSVRQMWFFSGCLYLAIFSHYSVLFFTVAMGLYALARIADGQLPRRVAIAWVCGQAGALAIYGFLYVTHVSKLKNSIAVWAMPFDSSYFHADTIGLFTFTRENTMNIFLFLFGERAVAYTIFCSFIAGVVFFFVRDLRGRQRNSRTSRLGILLLFPFVAVWGASLAGIYPYVGSRHTAFLAPFAIAAASYLIAAVFEQKLWASLAIAMLLMGLSNTGENPVEPRVSSGDISMATMRSAVGYMDETIPRSDLILVDFQSSLPLAYYFCGPKEMIPVGTFEGNYFEFNCNGYSIVSLHIWKLMAQAFPMQFEKMARSHSLKPGDRVWVYQTGWGADLGMELKGYHAGFRCLDPKRFGDKVTVTPFIVGPDFSPQPPLGPC